MDDDDSIASLVSVTRQAAFPDGRLRDRLASMTAKLAVDPSQSFPDAFTSAELEGAYRFFGNPVVTPDGVLSSHFENTRARASSEPTVLVVHDSSTFAFDPDGARVGLGRVRAKGQAFFAHVSLVLADDGSRRPLGLAALTTWVRGEEPAAGTERARWSDHTRLSAERLGGPQNLIHVMDREADDFAIFVRLVEGGHRFITRVAKDRLLAESTWREPRKLSHAIAQIEGVVHREAKLSKRLDRNRSPQQKAVHPSRGTRMARLAIGATSITLKRPETQEKTLPASLPLHLVRVWEPEPPTGEEPIEWLLLTTEPIDSPEALLRIVDRYRARWTIEEYFKAIKTGCAFSERQLGDYEGLVNALAVFAPIACRLLALRSDAQHAPDAPATRVLNPVEIEVLQALGRIPLSANPSARDALLAVAALGGHIKWSGEPGWLTISRGFTKLQTLAEGWRLARLQRECDQR
jgi:Transposase DNA-binding